MNRGRLFPLGLVPLAMGCVYYNSMWSANRLASDARKQEAQGQVAMAKLTWARAAVKAESIVIKHPNSRWADDALVLQVEGLANSGNCALLEAPRKRAEAAVSKDDLRERVALAGARCALMQGRAGAVPALLEDVVKSDDAHRRSVAYYFLGQSAVMRADWDQAIEAYGHSREPNAGIGRARALLAAGRLPEARTFLDTLSRRHYDDSLWALTLDDLARAAGDSVASLALDSLLLRTRLTGGGRGRLLLADGDRLRKAGRHAAAGARYAQVLRLVPDSVEAAHAEVRALIAAAGAAPGIPDLAPIGEQLDQLLARGAGFAQQDAMQFQRVLLAVWKPDSTDIAWFRAGEIARDTLVGPALAAAWFERIPQRFPKSLFAPKALIALAALRPAASDSVLAVLDSSFATSPYTLALRGNVSPAYEALEDSLGEALGLVTVRARVFLAQWVSGPVPGQKGPPLDPVDVAVGPAARPVTPGARAAPEAGRRPPPGEPVRPPPGQPIPRPTVGADDRP